MKKIFFLIAAVSVMACSQQEITESVPSATENLKTKHGTRSYDEALEIAQNAINMLENSMSTTRSDEQCRKIDLLESKVIMRDAKTRGDSDDSDSLIYVFNFENNEGFALVSASRNTEGLLAVTEKGHYDPTVRSEIEGFEQFLYMAKEYVKNDSIIIRTPVGPIVETKDSITYSYSQVGPYVTVRWGQRYPEGEFCPNYVSGCSNTAIAQVLSYYEYPTSINLTYQNGNDSTIILNWTNIKTHATGHSIYSCSTVTTHEAIGKLLRQIGEFTQSDYSKTDTTDTYTIYINQAFDSLGYTCGQWSMMSSLVGGMVRSQLNNGHLFVIVGSKPNDIFVSHTWVLDGYKSIEKWIREMARTETSGWFFTGEETKETANYYHFNWGGYGNCNGYYLEGVYDSSQAYEYDAGVAHNANLNYSVYARVLCVYH